MSHSRIMEKDKLGKEVLRGSKMQRQQLISTESSKPTISKHYESKNANISTCIERVILRGTFKQLMTANWSRWPVVNLGD